MYVFCETGFIAHRVVTSHHVALRLLYVRVDFRIDAKKKWIFGHLLRDKLHGYLAAFRYLQNITGTRLVFGLPIACKSRILIVCELFTKGRTKILNLIERDSYRQKCSSAVVCLGQK